MDICAASAFGSRLGNLLLRGIDNGQVSSLREAKGILAMGAYRHVGRSVNATEINKAAHYVLRYLADQLCESCRGTKTIANEFGVKYPCKPCAGSGFVGKMPHFWGALHDCIFREALAEMANALRSAREHAYEPIMGDYEPYERL